jgi:hypothetical protein
VSVLTVRIFSFLNVHGEGSLHKRLVADLSLDKHLLQEVLSEKL